MSRLSVLPILLAAALLSTAAAAAPWLSVANGGRDTVWRQRDGHLIVFERPGQMRVQRDFGPGLIGFSAAPDTTRVALWFARATGAEIFVWDYATDHISAAPTESAQTSAGLAWAADGRSLLLARPDLGGLTSVTGFLAPDTFIATPGLNVVHNYCALSSTIAGFLALSTPESVYLGAAGSLGLVHHNVELGVTEPATLRFSTDGQTLVAGGPKQIVILATAGGAPRALDLGPTPASGAFDLSTDGTTLYLAAENRLQRMSLTTSEVLGNHEVRPPGPRPLAAQTVPIMGAVAIAYDDGTIAWYLPGERRAVGPWPAEVTGEPVPPVIVTPAAPAPVPTPPTVPAVQPPVPAIPPLDPGGANATPGISISVGPDGVSAAPVPGEPAEPAEPAEPVALPEPAEPAEPAAPPVPPAPTAPTPTSHGNITIRVGPAAPAADDPLPPRPAPPIVPDDPQPLPPVAPPAEVEDPDAVEPDAAPVLPRPKTVTAEQLLDGLRLAMAPGSRLVALEPGASAALLDANFERLETLEADATDQALSELLQALVAVWLDRDDLVPAAWAPRIEELRAVDLAELRGVNLISTPREFSAIVGLPLPTGGLQRGPDGLQRAELRFGVFVLPVEESGEAFAPGATLRLSAEQTRDAMPKDPEAPAEADTPPTPPVAPAAPAPADPPGADLPTPVLP